MTGNEQQFRRKACQVRAGRLRKQKDPAAALRRGACQKVAEDLAPLGSQIRVPWQVPLVDFECLQDDVAERIGQPVQQGLVGRGDRGDMGGCPCEEIPGLPGRARQAAQAQDEIRTTIGAYDPRISDGDVWSTHSQAFPSNME